MTFGKNYIIFEHTISQSVGKSNWWCRLLNSIYSNCFKLRKSSILQIYHLITFLTFGESYMIFEHTTDNMPYSVLKSPIGAWCGSLNSHLFKLRKNSTLWSRISRLLDLKKSYMIFEHTADPIDQKVQTVIFVIKLHLFKLTERRYISNTHMDLFVLDKF